MLYVNSAYVDGFINTKYENICEEFRDKYDKHELTDTDLDAVALDIVSAFGDTVIVYYDEALDRYTFNYLKRVEIHADFTEQAGLHTSAVDWFGSDINDDKLRKSSEEFLRSAKKVRFATANAPATVGKRIVRNPILQ